MSNIGSRVKELREKHSLTQKELAEVLGFKSTRGMQYIEYGERNPDFEGLITLANHFNVSLDYLVGRSDDPSPPNVKAEKSDIDRLHALIERLNPNQLNSVTRFIESFLE
ncbi:helix-turn-helix domain-containing protein [Thermoactinomyces sp. DSM 45892]|uniref:helix-turn-helix domain-containing protein n=1 Tax=Thermoactinomyces sp. DSM 45892 TaxID=1882753 RepID=UPI00089BD03E|nr:helix-turn-helix transcriptional regulator [Thermoactinomyces sp. DSM 45892]SDZ37985.1 Helix-turn-helix [Thermoactinomyces sp. DSM 45892]